MSAPLARYRVLRGVVHHPGGVAGVGEIIALPSADGDPHTRGPAAVLECVAEPVVEPVGEVLDTPQAASSRRRAAR